MLTFDTPSKTSKGGQDSRFEVRPVGALAPAWPPALSEDLVDLGVLDVPHRVVRRQLLVGHELREPVVELREPGLTVEIEFEIEDLLAAFLDLFGDGGQKQMDLQVSTRESGLPNLEMLLRPLP